MIVLPPRSPYKLCVPGTAPQIQIPKTYDLVPTTSTPAHSDLDADLIATHLCSQRNSASSTLVDETDNHDEERMCRLGKALQAIVHNHPALHNVALLHTSLDMSYSLQHRERVEAIGDLQKRQGIEVTNIVQEIAEGTSRTNLGHYVQQHEKELSDTQLVWDARLSALQSTFRNDFFRFVETISEVWKGRMGDLESTTASSESGSSSVVSKGSHGLLGSRRSPGGSAATPQSRATTTGSTSRHHNTQHPLGPSAGIVSNTNNTMRTPDNSCGSAGVVDWLREDYISVKRYKFVNPTRHQSPLDPLDDRGSSSPSRTHDAATADIVIEVTPSEHLQYILGFGGTSSKLRGGGDEANATALRVYHLYRMVLNTLSALIVIVPEKDWRRSTNDTISSVLEGYVPEEIRDHVDVIFPTWRDQCTQLQQEGSVGETKRMRYILTRHSNAYATHLLVLCPLMSVMDVIRRLTIFGVETYLFDFQAEASISPSNCIRTIVESLSSTQLLCAGRKPLTCVPSFVDYTASSAAIPVSMGWCVRCFFPMKTYKNEFTHDTFGNDADLVHTRST
eukprot:PhF_6_TR15110/c0_g1_i1/m.23795